MNEYETINILKERNQVKLTNKLANILGVLLALDLIFGMLTGRIFFYIHSLIWFGFFISCQVAKFGSTIRLDIYYKK